MKHTRRSWTPRSGWRLRDRLDKAWRWPLYSRGRAIGTLAAAILVVVIWPQGAGSEQATVAAATATNPTAQTSEVDTSERTRPPGSPVPTSSTPDQGTNLTASPPPPTLTTSPEQYRTAEAVATQYLQVWCWQPAAAPANSNLTNTAPWITPAGQADDLTRSATSAAIPDLDLRPRHRHTDRRATQRTGPDPAPTVDPTGLHQHIRRHRQPTEDRTDPPNRPRPGRPLARRHAGAGRMKAVVAVITLGIAGLVLAGAIILGSSGPRSAPPTASSNTATPAAACTSSAPTTQSAAESVTPGMPAAALRHQGNPSPRCAPRLYRRRPLDAQRAEQPGIRATSSPIRCSTTAPR